MKAISCVTVSVPMSRQVIRKLESSNTMKFMATFKDAEQPSPMSVSRCMNEWPTPNNFSRKQKPAEKNRQTDTSVESNLLRLLQSSIPFLTGRPIFLMLLLYRIRNLQDLRVEISEQFAFELRIGLIPLMK